MTIDDWHLGFRCFRTRKQCAQATLRRNARIATRIFDYSRIAYNFWVSRVTWVVFAATETDARHEEILFLHVFSRSTFCARASSIWFSLAALFSLVSSQFKARCARVMVTNQADKLRDFRGVSTEQRSIILDSLCLARTDDGCWELNGLGRS